MGLLRTLRLSFVLATLSQITFTEAQECQITSISSPDASSLLVKWSKYSGATNYFLDLRVINMTDTVAPVVVTLSAASTERVVQGLRPGTQYSVTLKVFQFYYVMCLDTNVSSTVPASTQITNSKALSSSSIQVEWARVLTSPRYYLLVESIKTGERFNLTHTNLSAVVTNLQPSTAYNCSVFTANSAGLGASSRVRTISTLIQPPASCSAVQTGKRSALVSWQPVNKVLVYEVRITNAATNITSVSNVTATQLDLQNILPCSSYRIAISSYNAFLDPGEPTNCVYTTNKLSPVTSISVDYSCSTSSASVSWDGVFAADSYKAEAVESNGTVLSCTTQGTSCQIAGLGCGQSYVVHVIALSDSCESTANATTTFSTVPCSPKNLTLYRECASNVIIFSWAPTNHTSFYLARAVDSQGRTMDCMTKDTSCFFTETVCGRHYSFSVYSVSGDCNGQTSSAVSVNTAPCMPKNVITSANCASDVLTSSWDPADGALSYTVEAWGNNNDLNRYNCSSVDNSCLIRNVLCGESLTVHITAFDDECPSYRTLGQVAETVPCAPKNVSAAMDCGADSITLTWPTASGAVFYIATAMDEAGVIRTCNAVGNKCKINGLQCSSNYTAFVISTNLQCNSSKSKIVSVETAPCPPSLMEATLNCTANSALIVWRGDHNMASYTATMVDASGSLLSCSTTGNNCTVTSLKCGQLYAVTVAHHDGICPSMPSKPVFMESVPCGPANVQTRVNCLSGTFAVSWNASKRAEAYSAVIADGNGQRKYCNTTQTNCTVNTLTCGKEYTVTVMSVNGTCVSMPSKPVSVREVPCVPTNVTAKRTCGASSVAVSWAGDLGAATFTAVALGGSGHRAECSSNLTSCVMADLRCGEVYNVSVMAVDATCSSLMSRAVALATVPCPPTHVTAWVDCPTNTASLTWDASPNAATYTAKAVGTDGHSVSCASATPGCQLAGLHCGQAYVFTAAASDGSCASPDSMPITQQSAPCAPHSVTNSLNCSSNILRVSWGPDSVPLNYSATALSGNGTALSCTTTNTSCEVKGLQCGQQYSVTVKASNSNCTGPSSALQTVQTGPCMPTNLQGHVDCSSNTLLASWGSAPGALTYTSMLTSSDGLSTLCSSSNPSCSFPGLKCSQKYSLRVFAGNSQCNSSTSASLNVTAAPCDPKNVTARLQCVSGAVSVSWADSAGAKAYTAVAQLNGSNVDSCTSVSTSCDLSQLRCGNKYTVIVLAGDGTCNSSTLASTTVQTAPCPPVIQNRSLDCSTNRASVSWALSKDAVGVVIDVTSASGHSASCQSNSTSCVLTTLLCGQNYTARGFSLGSQCNSKPSDAFHIVTAPCTPDNVKAQYTCGSSKAVLSWDDTLGRGSFYALVTSGNQPDSCRTAGTQCSLSALRCGQLYNATVYAVSGLCNSSQPGTTQIQTAPCAPQNVSASLVCANNTAGVTWLSSPGAVGYNVLAVGRDGDNKTCATNGTSCNLSGMLCDKTYNVTVTPFSRACGGFQSAAFIFTTGPCPRPAVQVSLNCTGNVGSVSWTPGPAGELYVATATGNQGHAYNCSTNGTGCSFGGLNCGETYSVSVVTVKLGCRSEPSAPVALGAAICPPTNLAGVTACSTNNLNITWTQSPASSAVTYFLYSQKQGGVNATSTTTAGTSQLFSGLHCGEHFTFRVSVQDSRCTSGLSPAIEIDTAPCAPANLTAQSKCGTTKTALTWNPSAGAVAYVATVTGPNGRLASCVSNTSSCSVELDCGLTYSAAVAASTSTCNSTVGPSVQFDSARCLPSNVTAQLPSCTANSFALKWQASPGNPSSYTGLAIGSDGSRSTCNTSLTACTIQNLSCGTTYSLAVTTSSSSASCGTIDDTDYKVQSAPCKPTSPAVSLECSSNAALVTWQNAGPDQLHVVSAVDRLGRSKTCNSTGSNCTFTQLGCGEAFTLSVVGKTQTCTSEPSTTMNLLTAPCVPTLVTADVDCENGITMVTWDQARGALRYTVLAVANGGGHNDTCTNTDTICTFFNLRCGQVYTITVLAHHDSCGSLASQPITASTGPCPHSGLQASLDCSTNTAVLSWTPGQGIVSYNATAKELSIPHLRTCATTGSSCNISGLLCGENYRLSVRGEGLKCVSPALEWLSINTAPCPPTQLKVLSSCDSNTISVSWVASQGSLSYMAVAECIEGQKLTCNTTSATCNITGLLCGQEYKVYVVGLDDGCTGAKSNIYVLHTAPCVPANVQSQMNCRAAVLNVTWQQSGQTQLFHTSVQSSAGRWSSCAQAALGCVVPDVQCGLNYTVAVLASYESCNSSQSALQQVLAAPCPPDSVKVVVNCSTSVAAVTWNNSVAGVLYTATAVSRDGHQLFACSATQTGCNLRNLTCGTEYNVTVTPSRGGCVGADSPVHRIRTAPCIPRVTQVEADCLSDSAWVIWEHAAGAGLYVAVATDRLGTTYACNTTDSSCAVPELPCGQNFTFSVTAADHQCSSAPSNAVVSETAPCPPQDVEADMSCENGSVAISWAASTGAVAYTATLERTDGETTCCSARGTHCDITGLPCGEMYVLIVTAEGRTCNSSESIGNIVRTAPCTPQKLEGSVSCRDNVASMNWTSSRGGQLYTVSAVGTDGHVDKCSSFENTCDLTGLHCGQHYTASVVANDSTCNSPPSNKVDLRTVPCMPDTVSATVSCQDNSLKVSWSASRGADSFTASVEDGGGSGTTCQAMSAGFCNVSGLSCGQLYHVSVVASDGYCNSPPTESVVAPSVPCHPTQIRAVMDCESRVGMLTWHMSSGAVSYRATAITRFGQLVTCDTNNTHCYLDDLSCGEEYSVSVEARGENCSSVGHMTGTLITEPCVPLNPSYTYGLNIAQLSWDSSKGATSYSADAVTDQGMSYSCQTSDTYCALQDMACGQVYNVSITASNQVCQIGVTSASVSLTTEPCPPKNVKARLHCGTDMATMSWEESEGAVGYVAKMEGRRDGSLLSCVTTGTFCNVTGLRCGSSHLVTVFALGESLNSTNSATILLDSAPCVPTGVQAHVNCANDSTAVTWAFSNGADSYKLTATTGDGFQASCATTENHCNLTGLACGRSYNLSLTSVNQNCQVESPTGVSFSTRPCAPLSVNVDFLCGNNTATLFWKKTEGVQLYQASATPSLGGPVRYCNTTGSSCKFPGLNCGETYRFTVTAYNSLCQSESSNSVEVKTAPCQPGQLVAEGSCSNETVCLGWAAARGASVYVLTAAGDLGYFTALQTNDTALDVVLPCGQTYSFTVMAEDESCGSPASSTAHFKTAPCVPYGLTTYIQCEASLGAVSWGPSDGAESYMAVAVGTDGLPHTCTTNSTTCTWDKLLCGDLYVIQVIANDHLCSSSPSNSTSIHTAPCVPQNLTSSINCATKVTTLQWLPSHGAQLYVATAEASDGHQVAQSTNNTHADFSELTCGQSYSLSVQAVDAVCRSVFSLPAHQDTEPCPPTSVSSVMDCQTNIAVVSWGASPMADYYTATIKRSDGQADTCLSGTLECGTSQMTCGQNYTVTVTASRHLCQSDPSLENKLHSVPCVPTNVVAVINCSDNTARVSWNASEGALFYVATAKSTQGGLSTCESAQLGCTLTNLTCGALYSVSVVARDSNCGSLPSQSAELQTVPCTPQIEDIVLDCFLDSAQVAWSHAAGSLSYTVSATGGAANSSCHTNNTNCELLDLTCGRAFTVSMVGSDGQCDSFRSSSREMTSVPCPPEHVAISLDCSANSALVAWQPSQGAESYRVQAVGVQEHETGCETTQHSCHIPDLLCGFTYNISVVALNRECNVSESNVTQLQSVPCVPNHVQATTNCASNVVSLSWEPSNGATFYTAVASGSGGNKLSCDTNGTVCEFTNQQCGVSYNVTVSASDHACASANSTAVHVNTVPCKPQNVTAKMECNNNTGLVSWEQGVGVTSYRVSAFGPDGHQVQCASNATSCRLPGMHCGQLYNVTVAAQDGTCNSSSTFLTLKSVPCNPTSVKAALLCQPNAVAVTWEQASGAAWYQVVGVAADGRTQATCNNSLTFCDLTGLACGQTYNVTVFAEDEACSSVPSSRASSRTAPCPPQNVTANVRCSQRSVVVSWAPNPDADSFHAVALAANGAILSCNTTGTTCTILNLLDGHDYNVSVASIRGDCEGRCSLPIQVSTAPLPPTRLEGSLDCVTNSAWMTWQPSSGAQTYTVTAVGSNHQNLSCTTSTLTCNIPDLACGTNYTFSVIASNAFCNSTPSGSVHFETGPCALTHITVHTQCNSSTILVGWEATENTPLYLVTAEGQDRTFISCNSTSSSCLLAGVLCGMQYTIIVSASSDKCSSLRSPPQKVVTAPCTPKNVSIVPTCQDNGVTVSWPRSVVATSYLLTATGRDGDLRTCNTSVNNCSLGALHCGQPYSFSVTASTVNCTSQPSTAVTYRTVPCSPTGLRVDSQCETNSAVLSWNATEGAVEYYVRATCDAGSVLYCNSNATSCTIRGLGCGAVYNYSVQASDRACNSSLSKPLPAGAVPCPPATVKNKVQLIGQNFVARVSWSAVICLNVTYLVEVTGRIQDDPQTLLTVSSYWTETQYFEIPLPCSTSFNLTVRSRNSAGESKRSTAVGGITGPCPPPAVEFRGDNQSSVLSWGASVLAVNYTVYVTAPKRTQVCVTPNLSCNLTNVSPNVVEVTASNAAGESLPSKVTALNRRRRDLRESEMFAEIHQSEELSVPEVQVTTVTGVSLYVEWGPVRGATHYTLVVKEDIPTRPHREVMAVYSEFSVVNDLKPSTRYCILLSAKNARTQSSYSTPQCVTTGVSL